MSQHCYHNKKAMFETKRSAEAFVNNLDHIKNTTGVLRVYFCEYCEGYHLTSAPIQEQKKCHLKYYKQFQKYIG